MIALLLALTLAHADDEAAPVVEPTPDDEALTPSPREQAKAEAAARQAALEAMIEAAEQGKPLPEVQDDDAE